MFNKSSLKIFIVKNNIYIWIFIYLFFRLFKIMSLPIFNDEAIYIDWANKIKIGITPIFYSLYDGKPPLHFILISIFMFPIKNPLLAGRLLSVTAGLFTLIGIKKIFDIYFDKKKYYIPILLYIFSPMYLFYDRQSLQESLLTAEICWIIYFTITYFKKYEVKYIFFLSLIMAAALWTKISVLTLIFPIILIYIFKFIKEKGRDQDLFISSIVFIFSLAILLVPLFIQKQSSLIFSRNDRYSISLSSINISILNIWLGNIIKFIKIYFWYLNTYIIYVIYYSYFYIKNKYLNSNYLLLLFLIPVFLILLSSRGIIDRYLIPFSIPFIIIAGEGLSRLSEKYGNKVFTLIIPSIAISLFQIFSIDQYFILMNKYAKGLDLYTYTSGFTSGYGVIDAINFINEREKDYKKIYVGVRVDAGNPESAVMAYFLKDDRSKVVPLYFDSQFTKLPLSKDFVGNYYQFYYISRDDNLGGMNQYLTEIKRFYKPDGKSFVGVYKYNGNI